MGTRQRQWHRMDGCGLYDLLSKIIKGEKCLVWSTDPRHSPQPSIMKHISIPKARREAGVRVSAVAGCDPPQQVGSGTVTAPLLPCSPCNAGHLLWVYPCSSSLSHSLSVSVSRKLHWSAGSHFIKSEAFKPYKRLPTKTAERKRERVTKCKAKYSSLKVIRVLEACTRKKSRKILYCCREVSSQHFTLLLPVIHQFKMAHFVLKSMQK